MSEKQENIIIWCPKCAYQDEIKLPVEIDMFTTLSVAMTVIHKHNHECFDSLMASNQLGYQKAREALLKTTK